MRAWVLSFLLLTASAFGQAPTLLGDDMVLLRNFALSDDGTNVFFAAGRNPQGNIQGGINLYRAQVAGSSNLTFRLTNYPESLLSGVTHVAYPGSGTHVAYAVVRDINSQVEEIHAFDTGDNSDRVLATDDEGCPKILCFNCYTTCTRNVHISPDGKTVLYAEARNQPFYTAPFSTSGKTRLPVYQGALAPSGQRVITNDGKVVFTSSAPFGPTTSPQASDVYIMNLDGTNIRQVTNFLSQNIFAANAVITGSGDLIAFTRTDTINGTSNTQVWTVRFDGTGLQRVSDGTADATSPSISLDGRIVTFVQNGQVKQVSTTSSAITSLQYSEVKNVLVSGDGKRTGFIIGPFSGQPSAIYTTPINGTFTFSQLTQVFAPRVLFPSGLVSAGGTAAPSIGSLFTAYGANLGTEEFAAATQFPLPTKLGGIELLNDSDPLPLQAVTPWQVNAQLPQSLRPGTITIKVRDQLSISPDARTVAKATAPEAIPMYSVSQAGQLLAAAVFPGTKTLADAAHPAAANDTLEIYALGLGVTTPRVDAGVASPLANADVKPRVQIGGLEAEVTFAGLVPGLAGVYQVNVKIPAGLAPGYKTLRWVNRDSSISGTSGIFVR